jgi:hypothetical protein
MKLINSTAIALVFGLLAAPAAAQMDRTAQRRRSPSRP